MVNRFVVRVSVRESHPDGTARMFEKTRVIEGNVTVRELMEWRNKKIHDPLNGEFAAEQLIITVDDSLMD